MVLAAGAFQIREDGAFLNGMNVLVRTGRRELAASPSAFTWRM
jgi:hypothetical protein